MSYLYPYYYPYYPYYSRYLHPHTVLLPLSKLKMLSVGPDLLQILLPPEPLPMLPSADPALKPKSLLKVLLEGQELRLRSLLSALPPKQPLDVLEFKLRLLLKVHSDALESLLRSRPTALLQKLLCAGPEWRQSWQLLALQMRLP